MPHFYFDHHSSAENTTDNEGIDLPDENAARRLALESLGQLIIDGAGQEQTGMMTVEVRNAEGPVLRARASVVLE